MISLANVNTVNGTVCFTAAPLRFPLQIGVSVKLMGRVFNEQVNITKPHSTTEVLVRLGRLTVMLLRHGNNLFNRLFKFRQTESAP